MRYKKTFTLIEILIVVSILGVVTSLFLPKGRDLIYNYSLEQEKEKLKIFIKKTELISLLEQKEIKIDLLQDDYLSIELIGIQKKYKMSLRLKYLSLTKDKKKISLTFHPLYHLDENKTLFLQESRTKNPVEININAKNI